MERSEIDVPSLFVSLVSGAIAIWAIIEAKRASGRANDLQARQVALQERVVVMEDSREADRLAAKNYTAIEAHFQPRKLVLRNVGAQPAREVEVFVDGAPRVATDLIGRGKPQVHELLGVGAEIAYHVFTYDAMKRDYRIAVTWRDPAGKPGRWESSLELP
jgi:hypothetical protein